MTVFHRGINNGTKYSKTGCPMLAPKRAGYLIFNFYIADSPFRTIVVVGDVTIVKKGKNTFLQIAHCFFYTVVGKY